MVTQEWLKDELTEIEKLGFVLNFKGYFVKDDITLTKRLDVEFNELYYQAYTLNGMQISIPAYRIDNPFENFISTLKVDLLTDDIINFDKLLNWLKDNNIQCKIERDDQIYNITFEGETYQEPISADIEKLILYLVINYFAENKFLK